MSAVVEPVLLDTVVGTVASTLKIPVERLDVDADFDSFGMDSIIAIELMTNLSRKLGIPITPAQLTAVSSIRELAGAISESAAPPVAPSTEQAAPPAVERKPSVRPPAAVAARRPARPRQGSSAASLQRFVHDELGLDVRGERFASEEALADYLVTHHADTLSHRYGLGEPVHADHASRHDAPARIPPDPAVPLDIAVIGMACSFADAPTPQALWQNLCGEHSAIRSLEGDRWPGAQNAEAAAAPRWGARIEGVDLFDAGFFGLDEDEARMCDPQERLVMQSVYHALQHAGLRADTLRGSRTALFLGYEYAEYEHHLRRNLHRLPAAPAFSSSSPIYYLANRISFLYDFQGPSEVVNASCASSALAIHRAVLALAQGECDLAICGGVSLNLFADDYAAIARYGLLSPDGRCAVFDDAANGFTRGEGVGLLVLKRMDDADVDNNRIFAKVVATHQGNRGRAAFTSEIRHEAITRVIAECYERHAIAPDTVRYIEVDGYATKWGDSLEFEGIRNVFRDADAGMEGKTCALGSLKGNIGHVEPASGVASAIKVALSLHHGRFPPTIGAGKINSFIDIGSGSHPLYIADRSLPRDELRRGDEAIRAGVNSFSDSGVNVHLVFEECRRAQAAEATAEWGTQLFVFSARSRDALLDCLDAHVAQLQAGQDAAGFEDLAYTTQIATEPMEHRVALVASTAKELGDALARARKLVAEGRASEGNGPVFVGSVRHDGGGRIFDVIQSQIGADRLLENLRAGQLGEIALLWTSGIDMPWDRHWRERIANRRHEGRRVPRLVDAPAYPFARTRHWLDFDGDVSPVAATAARPPAPPAAALSTTASASARWRFVIDAEGVRGMGEDTPGGEDALRLFMVQESARLLGRVPDDIDEDLDFLALGFDSVRMAGLIQQLIDLLSESITPSVVFRFKDIPSLSRHLAEAHPAKVGGLRVVANDGAGDTAPPKPKAVSRKNDGIARWFLDREAASGNLIVPMQTLASGTPVFAVPGADGSVFPLHTLAESLADARPMFAFEAVGLDGRREPLRTVGEMADAYIEAMSAMRDTGEIDLLGYSNGAVVAFEMARKLSEKNVKIGCLVLIDQRCPTPKGRNRDNDVISVFADLIPALGGRQPLDAKAFAAVPEAERADYLHALMEANGIAIPREQFVATYRFALANDEACRRYRPLKIRKALRTVIVRATAGGDDAPPDLGWNRFLAKPAECIGIDTDHLSIVGRDASTRIAGLFHRGGKPDAQPSSSTGA